MPVALFIQWMAPCSLARAQSSSSSSCSSFNVLSATCLPRVDAYYYYPFTAVATAAVAQTWPHSTPLHSTLMARLMVGSSSFSIQTAMLNNNSKQQEETLWCHCPIYCSMLHSLCLPGTPAMISRLID